MANDFTGRIWKITTSGTTPNGTWNVKMGGGLWSGMAAAQTFIITDVAGRSYTFTANAEADPVMLPKLGWLSGPLAFSGTFTGEVDLFLETR